MNKGWVDPRNIFELHGLTQPRIHVHETSPDAIVGECFVNSYLDLVTIKGQFIPDEWKDKRVRVIVEII